MIAAKEGHKNIAELCSFQSSRIIIKINACADPLQTSIH